MSYNTKTITTSATEIVPSNTDRRNLQVVNTSNTAVVYIGPDASITASNAVPLYQNQSWSSKKDHGDYAGALYGIVSSGTADVRYWEESGS